MVYDISRTCHIFENKWVQNTWCIHCVTLAFALIRLFSLLLCLKKQKCFVLFRNYKPSATFFFIICYFATVIWYIFFKTLFDKSHEDGLDKFGGEKNQKYNFRTPEESHSLVTNIHCQQGNYTKCDLFYSYYMKHAALHSAYFASNSRHCELII